MNRNGTDARPIHYAISRLLNVVTRVVCMTTCARSRRGAPQDALVQAGGLDAVYPIAADRGPRVEVADGQLQDLNGALAGSERVRMLALLLTSSRRRSISSC